MLRNIVHQVGFIYKIIQGCMINKTLFYIFNLRTAAFKAYCAILVRRSNFRHQASPRESTQQRKVELWARNVQ